MVLLGKFFRREVKRNKDAGTVLERYWKSFKHALSGIVYCFKYEHNMIIIAICTVIVVIMGLDLNISHSDWLFIIFICGAIAACEMINSAVEAIVDLITTDYHELARIAKDTASAATLFLCIVALIGGLVIFLPKIMMVIGG
jgi:diacylglycerol kinase